MAAHKGRLTGVVALLDAGLSYTEIARRVGYSRQGVRQIARDHRPEVALARSMVSPPVPAWAHDVAADYRDHTRDFGEDYAARHCRRLLAEARAEEARAA